MLAKEIFNTSHIFSVCLGVNRKSDPQIISSSILCNGTNIYMRKSIGKVNHIDLDEFYK